MAIWTQRLAACLVLSIFFLPLTQFLQPLPETPLWEYTYSGGPVFQPASFDECSDGGFILCGRLDQSGNSTLDTWLLRTDDTGTQLWNYSYGGLQHDDGYSIIECSDGGFAVVGASNSYNSEGGVWLLRTDASGTHLWNHTYSNGLAWGIDLIECQTGGFLLLGSHSTPQDGILIWLLRTDTNGTLVWTKNFDPGLGFAQPRALTECSDTGFAILTLRSIDSSGLAWLIRTNTTGHLLWESIIGNFYTLGFDLLEVNGNGFAFTGSHMEGLQLVHTSATGVPIRQHTYPLNITGYHSQLVHCQDGGFAIADTTGNNQLLLARTDHEALLLWTKTLGPSQATDLLQTTTGNFLLLGDLFSAARLLQTPDTPPRLLLPIEAYFIGIILLTIPLSVTLALLYTRHRSPRQ